MATFLIPAQRPVMLRGAGQCDMFASDIDGEVRWVSESDYYAEYLEEGGNPEHYLAPQFMSFRVEAKSAKAAARQVERLYKKFCKKSDEAIAC